MMSWSQLYQEHLATIEAQAAKIAELEAAVRGLRKVMADDDTVYCLACGCMWGECDADCPWLTSGKLVGE